MTNSLLNGVDVVPVPLWQLDSGGKLTWCNNAYAALYGGVPDKIITDQKIIPVKGSSRIHMVVGGARLLFHVTMTDMPGGGAFGMAQNITREEELSLDHKRTQSSTKELLEHLSTAVATFTADQKIQFFNTAFARLWALEDSWLNMGPKLGEIMEKLRDNRRLPEQVDFRRYKQSWLDMFTNLIDPADEMMHLPNGTALRMLVVPNPSGGLMFTFEDVTSRLELEISYNTLVAVQRETLDNLSEGIAVFGGDGRLKLWNPAFATLWAMNPEDMDGNPHITQLVTRFEKEFAADTWPDARDQILAQVLNGVEIAGRLNLSNDRLIAYTAVLLPDGGVLVSHNDVTDSVRVENALRDKNGALEAAERLKLDFLANVSYQLRTPLNAIMGFTEILDNEYFGPLNEKQKQYTSGTREASERLISLIDDILDLSTIEAGYMNLDYDEVDIKELLETLQKLTFEWARKEGLDVKLDIDAGVSKFIADPRRLKQIILNLIRNAISYTPAGGHITLAACRVDRDMVISVHDTGLGIDTDDQLRIMEPFERGRNADAKDGRLGQGGAGLGLTLVRNIASLHGGHVTINSASETGTTVSIILPVTPA